MAKAYQHTADGYFAGEVEDYGFLPNNATHIPAPDAQEGYIAHWTGEAWEQVEDHKGETGYVNGEPYTIKDYGPYPDGWSDTPPPPTPEEQLEAQKAAFTNAIQQRLDAFAQTRNYDGIMSAATYATSTNAKFRAEGQYAVEARDATWAAGYTILDAVLAGERPMPTLEEVMAELPPLEWPE
jgi:hypothetical protein